MKLSKALLFLLVALLPGLLCANAQYTITQNHVSFSQTLSGHVVVGIAKFPVEGATVELRSADWEKVLVSTKTDKNGYFFLAKPKQGELFYMQISGDGINPYQLTVRIKKHAPKQLFIHTGVAT